MDAVESGYEAGSEASQTSSGSEISLTERKKPCEICGSNADDDEIMTCFICKDTREHTYCSRVMKHHVPRMWICDECFTSGRVVGTYLRSDRVVPIRRGIAQIATSSRTSYQVVDSEVVHDHNMTTCESGNQAPQQAHATSPVVDEGSSSHVPMDTSPFKIPDLNLPSDSGSEI